MNESNNQIIGFKALDYAITCRNPGMVSLLLHLGADVEKESTNFNYTPLAVAIIFASAECLKELLEKLETQINEPMKFNNLTPLQLVTHLYNSSTTPESKIAYQTIKDILTTHGATT